MKHINKVIEDLQTAIDDHDRKAKGPFVDLLQGRTLEHGHRMAAIAYFNALNWLKTAIEKNEGIIND